jgi:hypothetical protein
MWQAAQIDLMVKLVLHTEYAVWPVPLDSPNWIDRPQPRTDSVLR